MAADPSTRPAALPSLTGLRFIAAVLVFFFHISSGPEGTPRGASRRSAAQETQERHQVVEPERRTIGLRRGHGRNPAVERGVLLDVADDPSQRA